MNDENMILHRAIRFATLKHQGQYRKGSNIPYIIHPFEVAQILTSHGASKNCIIAGLLHDTLEDTETTIEEIRALFREDIATLVLECTEDKSKSWEERKEHTIEEIQNTDSQELLLVCGADKLSNLRSLYHDSFTEGDRLWTRFKRGKIQTAQYYQSIVTILIDRLGAIPMTVELNDLYQKVFINQ